MHRVPTKKHYSRARYTWRERAFVLAGIGVAGAASGIGVPLGAGEEILAPVWLGAIGWTFFANTAHVLWRGFRRGDRSVFRDCEPPEPDRDTFDWSTRTGAWTYMALAEQDEQLMRGNTH